MKKNWVGAGLQAFDLPISIDFLYREVDEFEIVRVIQRKSRRDGKRGANAGQTEQPPSRQHSLGFRIGQRRVIRSATKACPALSEMPVLAPSFPYPFEQLLLSLLDLRWAPAVGLDCLRDFSGGMQASGTVGGRFLCWFLAA